MDIFRGCPIVVILLVIVITISTTQGFLSHPSDDCIEGPKNTSSHVRVKGYGIFCMGVKDWDISYGVKSGCMKDASCDYFMSVKVVQYLAGYLAYSPKLKGVQNLYQPHVQWNLFAREGHIRFLMGRRRRKIPLDLDFKAAYERFICYIDTINYSLNKKTFVYCIYEGTDGHLKSEGVYEELPNIRKVYGFVGDLKGEKDYEIGAKLKIAEGTDQERIVKYNRVSLTSWNLGNDLNFTAHRPDKDFIPYFIGIKNVNGRQLATLMTPNVSINLLSDPPIPKNAVQKVSKFFIGDKKYLTMNETSGVIPFSTETVPTTEQLSMNVIFTVIGIMFVILFIVVFVVMKSKKKKRASLTARGPEDALTAARSEILA
jgi:hypothetical protein